MYKASFASYNLRRKKIVGIVIGCLAVLSPISLVNAKNNVDLDLTLRNGGVFNASQYKGEKPVYLKFWASWCQDCLREMDHLQETSQAYGESVEVVAVNVGLNESAEEINKVVQQFGLTLPIALDTKGELAKSLNLVGTPYHVLIDTDGLIVHSGHEANKELDRKLSLLSSHDKPDLPATLFNSGDANKTSQTIFLNEALDGLQVLHFATTWCESYLKESRPRMSEACVDAEANFNKLPKKLPNVAFKTIVSHLWTSASDVEEYATTYGVTHPIVLDEQGDTFFTYRVQDFPTFVVTEDATEVFRTKSFNQLQAFVEKHTKIVSKRKKL
ncbi:TlpA family protein disulfide reductase [Agaribacter marinus]|uniref:Thioredoxin domain-containing protein n=1 Tax=Agaribacter marinus TaxID=1431249 RepID=A0AA37T1H2_9ALTE|nr:redoxin family protein [Agaribacter marinus]GLR71816.1 hypothetical protein GCM10007852_27240 [Agaribacter marinus]